MELVLWQHLAIAGVLLLLVGPAVGNYATSVVYRLPIGQTPFEKHPYCGGCGTMLTPRDLFPMLSYLLARGGCRYCGMAIPPVYLAVELASGVVFAGHYLAFGISEAFIIYTALFEFLIILAALEFQKGRLFTVIVSYCFALAAIARVLADGSLYPMVQSGFLMLIASVIIWRLVRRIRPATAAQEKTGYFVPEAVTLLTLLGLCLPLAQIPLALAATGLLLATQRILSKRRFLSGAFAVGIWVGLLALYL